MPDRNPNGYINREKEIKLLHLDHLQRDVLDSITTKFIKGTKIDTTEVVEAFTKYASRLIATSSTEDKQICTFDGKLTSVGQNYFQKFIDAIFICSKHSLNYHKIFEVLDIKESLIKVNLGAKNGLSSNLQHELEYRIRIAAYKMLELDKDKVIDYLANIKDFYCRSLVTVNPAAAKRFFIDQIIGMICNKRNYTMSDIAEEIDRYGRYLGKSSIDPSRVEHLIHKYADAGEKVDEGIFHAAKVEIFKIMEGL